MNSFGIFYLAGLKCCLFVHCIGALGGEEWIRYLTCSRNPWSQKKRMLGRSQRNVCWGVAEWNCQRTCSKMWVIFLSLAECSKFHGFVDLSYSVFVFCSRQPDIFFSVMSGSTWNNVLSDSQRQHLRQFLPQFPDNNISEQDSTINDLFNNRNFNFGNPLHLAQRLFRGVSSWGDCIPASTWC